MSDQNFSRCRQFIQHSKFSTACTNDFVQDVNPSSFSKSGSWGVVVVEAINGIVHARGTFIWVSESNLPDGTVNQNVARLHFLATLVLHLPATSEISPSKTHRKGRRMSQEECWVHNKPRSWGKSIFIYTWMGKGGCDKFCRFQQSLR